MGSRWGVGDWQSSLLHSSQLHWMLATQLAVQPQAADARTSMEVVGGVQ